jgi:hypothetical protein
MGWIVFEQENGRAVKYYKKESTAKTQVTKHNNEIRQMPNVWGRDITWLYCSYADYEGVLMGLKEPERRMWAFCRG